MKIYVKVHPKSKQEKIKRIDESHLEVWVRQAPDKGQANQAVVEAVADFLGVSKSSVRVVSGATSRNKVLEQIR